MRVGDELFRRLKPRSSQSGSVSGAVQAGLGRRSGAASRPVHRSESCRHGPASCRDWAESVLQNTRRRRTCRVAAAFGRRLAGHGLFRRDRAAGWRHQPGGRCPGDGSGLLRGADAADQSLFSPGAARGSGRRTDARHSSRHAPSPWRTPFEPPGSSSRSGPWVIPCREFLARWNTSWSAA